MISAIVTHKGETLIEKFPINYFKIHKDLDTIGISKGPHRIYLRDNEESDIQVKLYSDNDFGSHLALIFKETDTLEDVQIAVSAISNAPDEVKEQLEEYVLNDQISTQEELYDTIREIKESIAPIITTFYCPLTGQLHDDEYGDINDVGADYIRTYTDEIEDALKAYQSPDMEMAEYITDHLTAKAKLVMATWSIDMIDGTPYGRIDCRSAEAFTAEEIEALKDGITGQNSDGLGEGFEQRPIKTDEGDLYVSLWHSGDDYFVHTQEEMDEFLNQNNGMKIGGM